MLWVLWVSLGEGEMSELVVLSSGRTVCTRICCSNRSSIVPPLEFIATGVLSFVPPLSMSAAIRSVVASLEVAGIVWVSCVSLGEGETQDVVLLSGPAVRTSDLGVAGTRPPELVREIESEKEEEKKWWLEGKM